MIGHNPMRGLRRLLLGLLALAVPVWAQLKVGNDLSMTMTGNIGFGYSGDYGNAISSDHSNGWNGDGNLNGYFYNPNFLDYYVRPMYNRSQADSGSQSITNATAVTMGSGIFNGSRFPGTVTFGKTFNNSGNFGLPGVSGFTTSGDSSQFGVGWSELLPHLPNVGAQYFQNSSSSTFFGSDQENHSSSRDVSLQSQYNVDGWMLTGRFNDLWTKTELPSFLTDGEYMSTAENSRTLAFNTNHRLPQNGSFGFSYGYGSFNGDGSQGNTSGSNQDLSANTSFGFWNRLTTQFGFQYDTSLQGMVEQQLVTAGSVAPQVNLGSSSHVLSMYNNDIFTIGKGLGVGFNFVRTQEEIFGQSLSSNHFSAVVNYRYSKPLWGTLFLYAGVNDQSTDAGHQGTGLVAGINFSRRVEGFDVDANFSYAQDVSTVLATTVTSEYSYVGNARRRVGQHLYWTTNFNGYHTGLSQIAGSGGHSEGVGTTLMYRGYGGGATYSTSYGLALLTASGLVSTPVTVAPVLLGNQYLLENSHSYTFVGNANPIKRWTINANYGRATYDTQTPLLYTANGTKTFSFYTACEFRKVSFVGGYTHLMQDLGAGATPFNFSTFYVGIQRWFKAF